MNSAETGSDLSQVEERLGYRFHDRSLLEEALTHTSFAHEKQPINEKNAPSPASLSHYERLEFLGDAVLDLAVGHLLLQQFPEASEGDLTQFRASLVNENSLAELALDLGLDQAILLGKGEDSTGGRKKPSILSSCLEAVVAAIFLDSNYETTARLAEGFFQDRIERLKESETIQDSKTRFQEMIQARLKVAPSYRVIQERGPDHDKEFQVVLLVQGQEWARAWGRSKKEAERKAAELAIKKLLI